VWVELTTLLIPGHNDGDAEIRALSEWVRDTLRPDVPLHFTAFHPDFKLDALTPTPPATLQRARSIAQACGLLHVYTGNVHDPGGGTTRCGECGAALIVRDWYEILSYRLDPAGRCPDCGSALAGCFGAGAGGFGARRIPVRIESARTTPGAAAP
jgi:pyruvate formate lyase activating enzyme